MERVQLSRRRGWRKPIGAVIVSRPSRWGNPFAVTEYGRAQAVAKFRQYLADMSPAERDDYLAPLREATALCCWCKLNEVCHADVLIEAIYVILPIAL